MKTKVISTILMALSLGAFNATAATAQGKKGISHEQMMIEMVSEPHHALAMAYHLNLANFTKVLHEQTARAGSVNVEFARAVVIELRRSFDQMQQLHQEYRQTMSADTRDRMSVMMKQMETHHTELITQLEALGQEIEATAPSAQKVTALTARVSSHLDAMSKMHQGDKSNKS